MKVILFLVVVVMVASASAGHIGGYGLGGYGLGHGYAIKPVVSYSVVSKPLLGLGYGYGGHGLYDGHGFYGGHGWW